MNEDPFKGATDTFATYLSNRDAARTAIEEAYKNNGLIDYTQAGQLINFIGYGAEWEPDQFLAAQQAILNANTEEGVNILSVMRQLVPELENLSDIEIWEEFGKLMDSS
jgi:hypothetical protein